MNFKIWFGNGFLKYIHTYYLIIIATIKEKHIY
jgi:hypothetical protein